MGKYKITLYFGEEVRMTFKIEAWHYHDVMEHAKHLKAMFNADDYTIV